MSKRLQLEIFLVLSLLSGSRNLCYSFEWLIPPEFHLPIDLFVTLFACITQCPLFITSLRIHQWRTCYFHGRYIRIYYFCSIIQLSRHIFVILCWRILSSFKFLSKKKVFYWSKISKNTFYAYGGMTTVEKILLKLSFLWSHNVTKEPLN